MDFERIKEKLSILADAAKYDVSCSSSGSNRRAVKGELGDTANFGICHSFTEDGRCISLLKILLTNHCKSTLVRCSQSITHQKTYIMARVSICSPYIAEARNQIFFHRRKGKNN